MKTERVDKARAQTMSNTVMIWMVAAVCERCMPVWQRVLIQRANLMCARLIKRAKDSLRRKRSIANGIPLSFITLEESDGSLSQIGSSQSLQTYEVVRQSSSDWRKDQVWRRSKNSAAAIEAPLKRRREREFLSWCTREQTNEIQTNWAIIAES